MRFVSRLSRSTTATAAALLLGALVAYGCGEQATQPNSPEGDVATLQGQDLAPAFAAQKAHTDRLLARDDVVGTGVGLTDDGEPSVVVYTIAPGVQNIPDRLDDVPVEKVVTGRFIAGSDPTTRRRPVPVGFSVGHPNITAGTYGARVQDGSGTVYMLSNNHVLADINEASVGDPILQPGPSDGGSDPADRVATLAAFDSISFSSDNTIDAAIAEAINPDSLLVSTPSDDGYGTPSSTPLTLDSDGDGNVDSGVVGTAVQKYGRTTGLTTGEVSEVNVTTEVCYVCANPICSQCSQSATMVDQIAVTPGGFSDGGDSGSLIVTNDGNNQPVALLFAGSDTRTLGNRIDLVLGHFGVTVDDGADGGGNTAPTASFTSSCTDLTCDFDASGSSDSDGSIASYDWDFGDGTTGTGQTVSHTYDADGTFTVTLTVTDDDGATDTSTQDVTVSSGNTAPTASFTSSCTDLTCDFDASGSSDSDGSIASYDWDFGDGTTGTGQTVSHTYDAGGTFTVTLTVTDDGGATDSSSQDVSVSSSTAAGFHVGDLDGSQTSQGRTWTASVTVTAHDGSHNAEDGSTVSFDFSGRDVSGSTSCTTGTDGTCTVTVSNIRKRTGSLTFTVTDLSDADGSYDATANHDPDGDSDGTTITVNK